MRLTDGLRLRPGMSVAFVGAGGKSAALACLAREAAGTVPIVLTTSTRLAREQSDLAPEHLIVEGEIDLNRLRPHLEARRALLVTGPQTDGGAKWSGLDDPMLRTLFDEVRRAGGVLAIEADGARGRSLKIPAAHEPRLPAFVDLVVPLVGLDVHRTTIDGGRVHRPEDMARFLAMRPDELIEETAITRVLASPMGGLKGVPDAAEVRPVINKIDHPGGAEAFESIAELLFGGRKPDPLAGVASGLRRERLQAVLGATLGASRDPVRAVRGRIAGVVLAAGGSTRMEQPKPLIPFRGRPLAAHAVQAARDAGLDPVAVVVGHSAGEVGRALESLSVSIIENADWKAGQSSSLRLGLERVERGSEGVVFFLADMPFVSPATVRRMVDRHRETLGPIVAPAAGPRRGNPVLFDRATFASLLALSGDTGGRVLFDRFRVEEVPCQAAELMDIDTPDDLERLWTME